MLVRVHISTKWIFTDAPFRKIFKGYVRAVPGTCMSSFNCFMLPRRNTMILPAELMAMPVMSPTVKSFSRETFGQLVSYTTHRHARTHRHTSNENGISTIHSVKTFTSLSTTRSCKDTLVRTRWDWVGVWDDQRRAHIRQPRGLRCWVDAACRPAQEYEVRSLH